jgi:hypothetical protein
MFLNIFFVHPQMDRGRCLTHGISMPSGLAIAGLIIASAVTVVSAVLLGYGVFALIEGVL